MFHFLSDNRFPLNHCSSGKLVNSENFIHSKRNLDTFVILIGCEGTLYIAQDDKQYELTPNKFIVLFPHHTHYGYRKSKGKLSYYWCHFQITSNEYKLLTSEQINSYILGMKESNKKENSSDVYILPEYGSISSAARASLIFRQLLDLANKKSYSEYLTNYALSLLAMEISQDFIDSIFLNFEDFTGINKNILEIINWINMNYNCNLSIKEIARTFNYNPDYLSLSFKKLTGLSLLKFINNAKISAAKQLLLNSSFSIKEIAKQVGFNDDKHFMKLFKKSEDITPTQYRNAYFRKKLNKN
ncbi:MULTISPECIES: AraC family transcriptional regulator [unclassified Clostridium]|uniref:AraC family transcriptional regulator n=1 Tax=unclassified Clostridium TaxID=2614128 RepID=UPI000297622C|nr:MULTISPECIES: AraC family transcriptional regulator [unclassified Clostridium]EKQ56225.1 MAG: DNA-binding domain-containing protein, AraC-type [Clostridium sp. Maddingley MBC34-26]